MNTPVSHLRHWASRVNALPLLQKISPSASRLYTPEEQQGFLRSQQLAQQCAVEVSTLLQAGWTEQRTAALMETWLRDHGVDAFFHKPFVWWGDRTRFVGVRNYWDYLPSKRVLSEGEVFILDVAPIFKGYVSDIGFSGRIGEHREYDRSIRFLNELRSAIPRLVEQCADGRRLWSELDRLIREDGWENIHATYPFGVLGHRLHRNTSTTEATFIHFGWQSYWDLISRGLFGQLWNKDFGGNLDGLWAIEPHIGGKNFGAKFEEILVIEHGRARWLSPDACYHCER